MLLKAKAVVKANVWLKFPLQIKTFLCQFARIMRAQQTILQLSVLQRFCWKCLCALWSSPTTVWNNFHSHAAQWPGLLGFVLVSFFFSFPMCENWHLANILQLLFFRNAGHQKCLPNVTWMQVGKTPCRLSATLVLLPYLSSFSPYKPDFA